MLDQPRGRLRQHHPARRGHRFHPLRHPDLLPDRAVTQGPRTDLTGDHPTRVQAHPHLEVHPVALSDFDGKPLRLLLNAHGRQAGTNRVVLQRHRGAEDRHHPVTGELHRPAAVAAHHRRRPLHQLGHDLAPPLHIQRSCEVHRAHHIGEQRRDLLVLRRLGGLFERLTTLVAELGVRRQFGAARPAGQARGRQCAAVVPAVIHAIIVSSLVRHVCHIAPGTQFTICTPVDTRLKLGIPSSCHRSELPTQAHGMSWAHFICPSKTSDFAIAR